MCAWSVTSLDKIVDFLVFISHGTTADRHSQSISKVVDGPENLSIIFDLGCGDRSEAV